MAEAVVVDPEVVVFVLEGGRVALVSLEFVAKLGNSLVVCRTTSEISDSPICESEPDCSY